MVENRCFLKVYDGDIMEKLWEWKSQGWYILLNIDNNTEMVNISLQRSIEEYGIILSDLTKNIYRTTGTRDINKGGETDRCRMGNY